MSLLSPLQLDMLTRLLVAMALGALVGYERERRGKRLACGHTAWWR